MAGITHAPYDSRGRLLSYPAGVAEWREVAPFRSALTFIGYSRGRSSVTFEWRDEAGRVWPMFITDFVDLMTDGGGVQGTSTGERAWVVCKRGQNYGIKRVTE